MDSYQESFTYTYTNPFTGELITVPRASTSEVSDAFTEFIRYLGFPRELKIELKILPMEVTRVGIIITPQATPTSLGALFYSYYTWWKEGEDAYPWGWYFKMNLPEFAWTHALCIQGICLKHPKPIDDEVHNCVLLLGEGAQERATEEPATMGRYICGHCAQEPASSLDITTRGN